VATGTPIGVEVVLGEGVGGGHLVVLDGVAGSDGSTMRLVGWEG
jgi:hypothetical protein